MMNCLCGQPITQWHVAQAFNICTEQAICRRCNRIIMVMRGGEPLSQEEIRRLGGLYTRIRT
jgi:hypothetical protein